MRRVYYINLRKRKQYAAVLLISVLVVATVVCLSLGISGTTSAFVTGAPAIKGVETEESVYAVSVILNSGKTENIRLVLSSCEGYGIKATCFMDVAWIAANKAFAAEVCKAHTAGLLLTDNLASMSRSELMQYIAIINDEYMSLTGVFPKYVRYIEEDTGYLSTVLTSYGQYYISAENILSNTAVDIKAGCITEINPIGEQTVYAFAKSVASAVSDSLKPISLSDLLYPPETEVNANGYQTP